MNKPSEYVTELFHKLREDIAQIKHRLFTERPKLESEQPPEYSIDAVQKDSQANEEASEPHGPVIRAWLNLPKTIAVKAETEESQKPWNDDRNFLLQIGAIAVGAAVAAIYLGQLVQMIESNRINREALESVQRAFVNFDHIFIERSTVHNPPPQGDTRMMSIKATWQNSGTTPALDTVRLLGADNFADEPTEGQFLSKNATPDANLTEIAPKATSEAGTVVWDENALMGNMLVDPAQYATTGKYLFVWGWITYRDVFPNTNVHLTEFCEGLHRITVPDLKTMQPNFEFIGCHRHNCTDEHCDDYQQVVALSKTVKN